MDFSLRKKYYFSFRFDIIMSFGKFEVSNKGYALVTLSFYKTKE